MSYFVESFSYSSIAPHVLFKNIYCDFKVNRIRSQHRINVHGCDVPDPVSTFEELQSEYRLSPRVLQTLKDAGLTSPTPVQMQAIPLMMHVSADAYAVGGF